jgi:PKD repeat protein
MRSLLPRATAVALVLLVGLGGITIASASTTAPMAPALSDAPAEANVAAAAESGAIHSLVEGLGPTAGHALSCTSTGPSSDLCPRGGRPAGLSATWTNLTWQLGPFAGPGSDSMAYDSEAGFVLYNAPWGTWTYSQGNWTNLSLPVLPRVADAGMVDDPADGYVLLWGGEGSNLTWEFSHGAWNQLSPTCYYPGTGFGGCASLYGAANPRMTYDAATRTVLLLDGVTPGPGSPGFWTYSNGTWTDRNRNGVANPELGAIAYDTADGYVVGFGTSGQNAFDRGNGSGSDTWTWSNGTWTNISSSLGTPPPARYDEALAYDSEDGYLLMYGGWTMTCRVWAGTTPGSACTNATVSLSSDTWKFRQGVWTDLSSAGNAPPWAGPALVDDPAAHAVLLTLGQIFAGCGTYPCYADGPPYGPSFQVWTWGTTPPIAGLTVRVSPTEPVALGNVSFTSTFRGGTPLIAFTWQFGDGTSASTQNATHVYGAGGTYTVTLYVNDSGGHAVQDQFLLTVVGTLSFGISAYPNPTDQALPVNFASLLTGGTAPFSYSWVFGDGGRSTVPDPSHSYSLVGFYAARLWVNDSVGASQNASVTVRVDSSLSIVSVTAAPSPAALGTPVDFSASATGGSLPYTYSWAFGDGGIGGNLANITHIYTTNGPFVATFSATDAAGAVATSTIGVTIALNVSAASNTSLGAAPLPVGFASEVSGGTPSYSFLWQFGDGTTSAVPDPSHTYERPGSFEAVLEVTDARGRAVTTSTPVDVAVGGGTLTLVLSPSNGALALGATTVVTAQPSGGVGKYDLVWTQVPLGCSEATSTSLSCTPPSSGMYPITATLADAAGHSVSASAQLTVGVGPSTEVPHGLSPAGDLTPWVLVAVLGALAVGLAGFAVGRTGMTLPRGPPTASDRYAAYRRDATAVPAKVGGEPPAGPGADLDDLF